MEVKERSPTTFVCTPRVEGETNALVTTAPINAVVAHITQETQGEYGPYQSVLFESAELKYGKLWRALKPQEAQSLHKGQAVALTPVIKKSKESGNICLPTTPAQPQSAKPQTQRPTPPSQPAKPAAVQPAQSSQLGRLAQTPPPPAQPASENRREQIAAYVDSMGDLYAHCLQVAQQKLEAGTYSETIRCMASSLFISAQRRFLLTSPK
ncbi:MAG: hypothetical protein DCF25_11860 [Leptolyngbya foveolarum]|uniref:Uncharacterized protein n=1 Tax=Leptolyngbya foveolarum TaxID=47253 RepID=A0A2W4U7D0_9CYAN|nr:MAG: hypothetical protein DCF25_11860 [Leptolyngbya foveolarum]